MKPAVSGAKHQTLSPLSPSHIGSVTATATGTGSISGKVTDDHGVGLADVAVDAYTPDLESVGDTMTDETGSYSLTGLPNVIVRVTTFNWAGYLDEWYDNIPAFGNYDGTGATPLDLAATIQSNIDFALDLGHTVSGKVTDASGKGIAGVSMEAVTEDGSAGAPRRGSTR